VRARQAGGLDENPVERLRRHDGDVDTVGRTALARRYGRPLADRSTAGFPTARRRNG
jgi:hypothetical protein